MFATPLARDDEMKVMIVNAYGRSNRGDSVLLDECIAEIREAIPHAEIGCAIYEGSEDARGVHPNVRFGERIGNSPGHSTASKLLTLVWMSLAALATVPGLAPLARFLPRAQRHSWHMIREADVLVSAPGGYIHDTNFAFSVALFHIWLARQQRTRVILAPQSIGPIDAPLARRLTRAVLARTDAICTRESYSHDFLVREIGLSESLLRRSGDSAFWNEEVATDPARIADAWREMDIDPERCGPILGLTVVDWSFPKAPDVEAQREGYVRGLATVIDHMSVHHGMRAVIFNQVTHDLGMAHRVASACRAPVAIDRIAREPEALRALIAHSTIFLGTRFHSCIFAMMAGCPTFAIAYLPKTSFILRDLKLETRQVPITDFVPAPVIAALEGDLCDLDAARSRVEEAVKAYRCTHARLSDTLREPL